MYERYLLFLENEVTNKTNIQKPLDTNVIWKKDQN